MNKNKICAVMTAIAMLFGMAGCSGSQQDVALPTEPAGATMTVALSHSCKSVPLTDDPVFQNSRAYVRGGKIILQGWVENATVIGMYDLQTGTLLKTEIPRTENHINVIGCDYRDGHLTLLTSQYGEVFDGYTYSCQVYDEQLQFVENQPAAGAWDKETDILCWRCLSDGTQLFLTSDGFYLYDEKNGSRKVSEDSQGTICFSADETVWLVPSGGKPKRLDREELTLEPLQMEDAPKANYNNEGYYDGFGSYTLLCTDKDAMYGLDVSSGTKEELVNFADSDLVEASDFAPLPDGRFLARSWDYLTLQPGWLLLTPRTQEEMDSIHTVTLAALDFDQDTQTRIARFNRQSEQYRLVLKSYWDSSSMTQDYNQCLQNYQNDLISGNVPDIMLIGADYQMLSNKGLFEDLRPWMENDPDFHEEDYLMNVLEAGEYKGHIERIPWSFAVSCFSGKKQYLGDKTSFTPEELYALDLPETMHYFDFPSGRTDLFTVIQHQITGHFVDYENGTCSFDSPEYISLLELVNTVPQGQVKEDDYGWREDRILLNQYGLTSLNGYHALHKVYFGGADITLCGIGYDGGVICQQGGIAVSAQSKEKEAAWEFIKFNLREEHQYFGKESSKSVWLFPINRAALEKSFADQITAYDEHHSANVTMNGENVPVDAATKEESETLIRYLESLTNCPLDDSQITSIVSEEAGKYFAGDCTAESAAKAIQGRVSLYLSEQG